MIIRKAEYQDVQKVADTYTQLLIYEAEHGSTTNWRLNVYPTIEDAQAAYNQDTLYVLEENDNICASMILNNFQADVYKQINWKYAANDDEVIVVHTLCIAPSNAGKGYGTQMIEFVKEYACENKYKVIRLDTWEKNIPAKTLYLKKGFHLAGSAETTHGGSIPMRLIMLEYKL